MKDEKYLYNIIRIISAFVNRFFSSFLKKLELLYKSKLNDFIVNLPQKIFSSYNAHVGSTFKRTHFRGLVMMYRQF